MERGGKGEEKVREAIDEKTAKITVVPRQRQWALSCSVLVSGADPGGVDWVASHPP